MEDRLHTTEVAVKSTRTHEMLRRPPICCECYLHTAYYFASYYAANNQSQEIRRAVIPVASDHRRAETKSDRWHQIHRASLE